MIFKKRVNGSWSNTPHYIHNTSTDTLTTLPAVLYPNAVTATVGLKGDMSQTGTPSPQTPIQPQECGERTGNLWDGTYKNNWGVNVSGKQVYITSDRFALIIPVDSNTDYTISRSEVGGSTYFVYGLSSELPNDNTVFEYCDRFDYGALSQTVNSQECNYLTIFFGAALSPNIMVNTGSTALPYEPYGVKIPILSANTTTPVYLGEVESTRKIKKLVFTGEENWLVESGVNGLFTLPNVAPLIQYNNQLCTHFSLASSYVNFYNTDLTFAVATRPCILIHYNACQTVSAFKAFLASEYAAGHPVTVWYILPTPQTAVVNEPLRKIGNYADEVSGITIPTIAGANTLSVGTTLQPSEVSVNYHGWHPVSAVHERINGAWT